MQLLDIDTRGPSTWKSPRKCAFMVIVISAALLALVFVAGFFTGKSLTTFADAPSGSLKANRSLDSADDRGGQRVLQQEKWQDSVCSFNRPSCPWSESEGKSLVLISLDGFRAEYLTRDLTPSILTLAQCGVTTPYMRSSYPTKTFPNHYTIVTGLFPESHGIIDNTIFDPVLNHTFRIGTKEMQRTAWWIGEPIWETVQKQGKRSATYFWPGSDVEIHGVRPTFNVKYNRTVPFNDRVDQVLEWLTLPKDQRPHLLTVYLEEPDFTGHQYGPDSPQIDQVLPVVDAVIDRLMTGLEQRDLLGCANVIIVSDHGMAPVSCENVIFLDQLTSSYPLHTYVGREGASPRIRPDPPLSQEEMVGAIDELNCQQESARFYDKTQLPKRYHYANSPRIDQIVIDLDQGWTVYRSNNSVHYCEGGAHGYDSILKDMRAIFVANGPSLKQHVQLQPFLNVEVYNLMCDLMAISPSPNNGTGQCLREALTGSASPSREDLEEVAPHVAFCQETSGTPPPGCGVLAGNAVRRGNRMEEYAPWGLPVQADQGTVCVIANEQYVLGHDASRRLPAWASFSPQPSAVSPIEDESWYHDERAGAVDCEELRNTSAQRTPLFPNSLASNPEARYVTNAVPMYSTFKNVTLDLLENKMRSWLLRWGSLNVVTGPVWDRDADGLPDEADGWQIPSHYFYVITRCLGVNVRVEDCDESSLDNLNFILPHEDLVHRCVDEEDHLLKHLASVRDVELATGLRFYSDMHNRNSLLLRLKLPESLWPVFN